jgi:hypothetical protein
LFIYRTSEQINELKNWAADLRNPQYKQCRGKLCIFDAYCCLGILAKKLRGIPQPLGVDLFTNELEITGLVHGKYGFSLFQTLNLSRASKFDDIKKFINGKDPRLVEDPDALLSQNNFMIFNDDGGWTFNEIANYIDYLLEVVIREKENVNV